MGGSRKRKSRSSLSDDELRRYIKLLIVPVVILVLILVIVVSNYFRERGGKGQDEIDKTPEYTGEETVLETSIVPDNKEYTHDFGESPLKKDEVLEINQLMEAYFQAEADCDVDKFNSLFTSGDTSQSEQLREDFEMKRQYVEGYQNIICYTVQGPFDNYYMTYVYYEKKYRLADTPAPGLIHAYVVQGDDGVFRIKDGEITEELDSFQKEVEVLEDVRLLSNQVDNQLREATAKDENLGKIIDFLEKGSHPGEAEGQQTEEQPDGEQTIAPDSQSDTSAQ